jgi:glutathione S-transferase
MPDYALYYWSIPFRGHFVRYLLAQVGAEWQEPGVDALVGLKQAAPAEQPYPFMAPPLLHDLGADRWLSQMPAIVTYLGRKHGLPGDPDEALRLVCDASDILLEITRHHGEQMWDRPAWDAFTGARLPRWMELHEALAAGRRFDAENPGVAELTLAALWHTMVDRLPGLRPLLVAHAPTVAALADAVAALPRIAAMRAGWDGPGAGYCGGRIEASLRAMLAERG